MSTQYYLQIVHRNSELGREQKSSLVRVLQDMGAKRGKDFQIYPMNRQEVNGFVAKHRIMETADAALLIYSDDNPKPRVIPYRDAIQPNEDIKRQISERIASA